MLYPDLGRTAKVRLEHYMSKAAIKRFEKKYKVKVPLGSYAYQSGWMSGFEDAKKIDANFNRTPK